jgi:small subunit ribosomal protein S17
MSIKAKRKVREGVVTSDKMDKTITVKVARVIRHRLYKRTIRQSVTFKAHDEKNECKIGDKVRIIETRPLSATKRWNLLEVLERSKTLTAAA